MELCIGLFGTCSTSKWREPFIAAYESFGIPYYNPQVAPDTWVEEDAVQEAYHLANDAIILFPVTRESYGTGSLAETGFSITNAIKLNENRNLVILIERDLDPTLNNARAREESLRARHLVHAHISRLRLHNVFLVDTLDDMLRVSLTLFKAAKLYRTLDPFSTAYMHTQ